MLCNIFVKYVLTLQPINKGQCRANNDLPTNMELRYDWQKEHEPNLSGTKHAYVPNISTTKRTYSSWSPK